MQWHRAALRRAQVLSKSNRLTAMTETFASTDDARAAGGLTHARLLTLDAPLDLEAGGRLERVEVCYETYGTLNAAADNAVLICHAVSGDSHVARHDEADAPGWWDLLVGPGRFVDTDRHYVVCSNVLGGCRGTTGPGSTDPATGRPYGADFPAVTLADLVEVQRRLLASLGVETVHAVVGGSMGGHQALTWATRHGGLVKNCVLLATGPRLTSQALAFDVVGRNAILRDPHYHGGQYYDQPTKPAVGLALARMLGHITYLSREGMTAKFDPVRDKPRHVNSDFEKLFGVGSYLAHQGDKFVERFDANSYVTLTRAMDAFDLGGDCDTLTQCFGEETSQNTRFGVVSFSSDWLFPPEQSRQMAEGLSRAGRRVSYLEITSDAGHDAFLLPDEADQYGPFVEAMLAPAQPAATGRVAVGGGRTRGDQRVPRESARLRRDPRPDPGERQRPGPRLRRRRVARPASRPGPRKGHRHRGRHGERPRRRPPRLGRH